MISMLFLLCGTSNHTVNEPLNSVRVPLYKPCITQVCLAVSSQLKLENVLE